MSEINKSQELDNVNKNNSTDTSTEIDTQDPKSLNAPDSKVITNTPKPEESVTNKDGELENGNNADSMENTDYKAEKNQDKNTIVGEDYSVMSIENLTIAIEKLTKKDSVQEIKQLLNPISLEFKNKIKILIEEKKESFINDGGNEIDFHYQTPIQKRFNEAYKTCKKKIKDHYETLEKNFKENLELKLQIIEEIKNLIGTQENINTTYNHFKTLQERWRKVGPIPKDKYNNAWNSYHHHVENFYDFLHINRDLRDLDFKHNLEKKQLIIERAEALSKEEDILKAFGELQQLHKIWKEELGPVAREHRDAIWERFKKATKAVNDKLKLYYQAVDEVYKENLEKKLKIIDTIKSINFEKINSHGAWQKQTKAFETLREDFFNTGKVPLKANEKTWAKFKDAVRIFNREKNAFYKNLKKEQLRNLELKQELIEIAEENKESEDFETTTQLMKKIQSDWKKIGPVPRSDSDKIWNQFKAPCNYFFNRINDQKEAANKALLEVYNKKEILLSTVIDVKLPEVKEEGIQTIKSYINQWRELGKVPHDKREIDKKFQTAIDDLLNRLNIEKTEAEIIKYETKLDLLNALEDTKSLDHEKTFICKKIDEVKGQINQLENNLLFFSRVKDDNPLVKEVKNNINKHKEDLSLWEIKLRKIKTLS